MKYTQSLTSKTKAGELYNMDQKNWEHFRLEKGG